MHDKITVIGIIVAILVQDYPLYNIKIWMIVVYNLRVVINI